MSFCSDYYALFKQNVLKYGSKTVVLMNKGTFYEIYEYCKHLDGVMIPFAEKSNLDIKLMVSDIPDSSADLPTTSYTGNAVEIGLTLNMRISACDKNKPHSPENPFMVGFPCLVYDLHRQTLMKHGYTIVRMDQKKEGSNFARHVVEVVSSSTEIDTSYLQVKKNIVCIYIECVNFRSNVEKTLIVCGMSCIDVSTGKNMITEVYSKECDEIYALQEIYRFLSIKQPIEVLLYLNRIPADHKKSYTDYVSDMLDMDKFEMSKIYVNEVPEQFADMNYQNLMLEKAFFFKKGQIVQNAIDQLNLERFTYGRISYCLLLQYCHTFNENLIKSLIPPEVSFFDEDKHLILAYNACFQFNILPAYENLFEKKTDSLYSIVNNAKTKMGERFIKSRLLHPLTDTQKLNQSYALTEEFLQNETLLLDVAKILSRMTDIEKLHRKIHLQNISPKEMSTLMNNYLLIIELHKLLSANAVFKQVCLNPEASQKFNDILSILYSQFDPHALAECHITKTAGGKLPQLEMQKCPLSGSKKTESSEKTEDTVAYEECIATLNTICAHLSEIYKASGKMAEPLNYEIIHEPKKKNDKSSFQTSNVYVNIQTTETRGQIIAKSPYLNPSLAGLQVRDIDGYTCLSCPFLDDLCSRTAVLHRKLEDRVHQIYISVCNRLGEFSFSALNDFIVTLDFSHSNAVTARKNKYMCPRIIPHSESYVQCKDLRHPLSEKLVRAEYVSNNISVGRATKGMLIYGVNSSGKSCLIKAVALAVVMAQAGMHVPCEMEYSPYYTLITRLSGEDNILKNLSSFMVEMTELRTILRNSNNKTLVVGDELCRGTENRSATALTLATLEWLLKVGASFLFSSHLFTLTELELVKTWERNQSLCICHLDAYYDETLEKMIYKRKLSPGPGNSLYGIFVCQSLNFDREFIGRTKEFLQIMDQNTEFVRSEPSKYNKELYVDCCILCKSRDQVEEHHIAEQHKADEKGFIGTFHKNVKYNLLPLCRSCHQKLHAQKKELAQLDAGNEVIIVQK